MLLCQTVKLTTIPCRIFHEKMETLYFLHLSWSCDLLWPTTLCTVREMMLKPF